MGTPYPVRMVVSDDKADEVVKEIIDVAVREK
jgi:hypothetical protein